LNFLMRLSGIATHTRDTVRQSGQLRVVDTRKTTPLHRRLERAAVCAGGGSNHRFALYDGVLIKDNHIQAAGGLTRAVERARANVHHLTKIEVEVENLTQLTEALDIGVPVVLLDNMTDEQLKDAVAINAGRALLEASGNMNAQRLPTLDKLGVNVVSMGGLIHQAVWVDLSLRLGEPTLKT